MLKFGHRDLGLMTSVFGSVDGYVTKVYMV